MAITEKSLGPAHRLPSAIDADHIRRPEDWEKIVQGFRNSDSQSLRILSNGTADKCSSADINGRKPKRHPSRKLPVLLCTPRLVQHLISSIKACLVTSSTLTELELAGIPLQPEFLLTLSKGLSHARCLKRFSLARSHIGDEGLYVISPSLKTLRSLSILNFGACNLTAKGGAILADLLNGRAIKRQAAIWERTLRSTHFGTRSAFQTSSTSNSSQASVQGVPAAIKRLILSHNDLGDTGVHYLMESLVEEIGLLALDLQFNAITDVGARVVEQVLHLNKELVLVDLRSNSLDETLWDAVCRMLSENTNKDPPTGVEGGGYREIVQTKSDDPDLRWLNGLDPLKNTYYHPPPRFKFRGVSRYKQQSVSATKLHKVTSSQPLAPRPPFKVGIAPTKKPGKDILTVRHAAHTPTKKVLGKESTSTKSFSGCNVSSPPHRSVVVVPQASKGNQRANQTPSPQQHLFNSVNVRSWVNGTSNGQSPSGDINEMNVLLENALLRRRLREMEETLLRQKKTPGRTLSTPDVRLDLDGDTSFPIKRPDLVNGHEALQLSADRTDERISRASFQPTEAETEDPCEEMLPNPQLDSLIQLMEASLKGFHALLDRMEADERVRRKRRRRRAKERNTHRSKDTMEPPEPGKESEHLSISMLPTDSGDKHERKAMEIGNQLHLSDLAVDDASSLFEELANLRSEAQDLINASCLDDDSVAC
ncbi:uncharacterized protein SPPG_09355 [Spizellomyces punctatus DAOM BR117]|uniref:Uncharacterized protein n=1 Tax=Spizellomyces punctatus (strain DAOM BR117) TaxID=645134 RepID=A0A0L0HA84_SPIPD|nr:uncharacterized protein SPPG_09355 [Spizellomyces punctatus DAOM BR117]KNC98480.1 hypothetical protein SPPG_09355 [Spizellomyces punctatus DAOM BR117]|eukprot:XP_016606520.1 hypothetical protein SPPG_09355 [Spizellomyces punctatus DAOM BR117]